jgi:hypothetical protein
MSRKTKMGGNNLDGCSCHCIHDDAGSSCPINASPVIPQTFLSRYDALCSVALEEARVQLHFTENHEIITVSGTVTKLL